MNYKFGDIVLNKDAGKDNPYHVGIIVRNKYQIECTDGKGNFWKFYKNKNLRLEKIDSLDLSPYKEILESYREALKK